MKLEHVDSSAMESVGYDPSGRTLVIAFTSGAVYRYADVPPDLHARLMTSSSLGEFFATQIRDAGFDFERMD